jgi:hypothetical protein
MTTTRKRPAQRVRSFTPTKEQQRIVRELASIGIREEEICPLVLDANGKPISLRTLQKHFPRELAESHLVATNKVAQTLYRQAIGGNTVALIFWLKAQGKWREMPQAVELTGANGGPVRYQDMSNAQLDAIIARARERRRK